MDIMTGPYIPNFKYANLNYTCYLHFLHIYVQVRIYIKSVPTYTCTVDVQFKCRPYWSSHIYLYAIMTLNGPLFKSAICNRWYATGFIALLGSPGTTVPLAGQLYCHQLIQYAAFIKAHSQPPCRPLGCPKTWARPNLKHLVQKHTYTVSSGCAHPTNQTHPVSCMPSYNEFLHPSLSYGIK